MITYKAITSVMEVIPKYKRENSFFVLKVKSIYPAILKRKTKKLLFIDLVIDKRISLEPILSCTSLYLRAFVDYSFKHPHTLHLCGK